MSFTEVFGGETLYPAGQTYLELTFSADVQLQWPIEQAIAGVPIVASIMDLNATLPGLNVDLPDARQVSKGIQSVFTNFGSNTVTVRDADGGAIVSLDSGQSWVAYLTDNTTNAGSWRIFQLGATVSVANASALAGAGLKAIATTLNQTMPPTSTATTPINLVDADRAMLTIWTGGVGVLNLPTAASVGADWFTIVRNSGTGDLTVTPPSGLINGFSTLVLAPSESTFIVTDGTNWYTVGLGLVASSIFDFIQINVAGSGDYTLSGSELNRIAYRFNGLLTNDRTIIVPTTVQQYWVDNSTTGAFSLFVKTAAQVTPVEVFQGGRQILYCDGAEVVDGDTSQFPTPLPVAFGGTGVTTIEDWPVVKDLGVAVPVPGDFFVFQDIDDSDQNKKAALSALPPPSQLVDSGNNVRISAELLGVAELRSDGNTDAEIRTLVGTYADQTIRWGVGQPTASPNLIIENLMTGGAIELRSGPASSIGLYPAGTLRLLASSIASNVDMFADGNSDTESQLIQLKNLSGNVKGDWGWTAAEAKMHIANLINGQEFELRGEDFGGNPRTYFLADPDGITIVRADTDIDLQVANGETAFYGTANGKSAMFFNNAEAARTVVAASGGMEVDNQDTGLGFERVLTTSDLGGGVQNGCKCFRTSNSPTLTTDTPTVIEFTVDAYDTNNFHDTVTNRSRITIPAGVSVVVLRASMTFNSYLSGGKSAYFTRGGTTLPGQIDNASAFLVSQEVKIAGGVGQNVAVQVISGQIQVTPGQFFEVVVESINQTGVHIMPGSWFEIEVIV
jgi:hypothetical protein